MSYILEALRKSERQRREIAEEPLVRLSASPPRRRSRLRTAIVLLSALTNVVVLAYVGVPMLFPGRIEPRLSAADPAAPSSSPAVANDDGIRSHPPAVAAEVPSAAKPGPLSTPPEPTRPAKPKSAIPSPGVKVAPASQLAKQPPRQRAAVASTQLDPDTVELPVVRSIRPGMARLPEALTAWPERPQPAADLGGLPQPKINVYAYTARVDGDRFVIIRNRKYREGDRIDDGPVVRRIEEHGMTLEFAGQTYKVPRP